MVSCSDLTPSADVDPEVSSEPPGWTSTHRSCRRTGKAGCFLLGVVEALPGGVKWKRSDWRKVPKMSALKVTSSVYSIESLAPSWEVSGMLHSCWPWNGNKVQDPCVCSFSKANTAFLPGREIKSRAFGWNRLTANFSNKMWARFHLQVFSEQLAKEFSTNALM